MSYFSVYVMPTGEPQDGPDIASNSGWATWTEWVLGQADQYPEAAHLAQEGWLDGADDLAGLEHDLEQLVHEATTNPNLTGVTAQILAALRARPEGALGLLVTDGEGGDDAAPQDLDEHIGITEDGETWFSEALYERLSEAAGANLVRKQVQVTRNGKTFLMWVRVRPNTATGADRHAAPGGVHGPDHVVSRALADPSQLTAADVTAFADHVGTLDREQLRRLNLAFQQKIGGNKTELAKRLKDHIAARGAGSNQQATATTQPAPAMRAPQNVILDISPTTTTGVKRLFGRDIDPAHLAAMSNAPDGAQVKVRRSGNGIECSTKFMGGHATRTFRKEPDGSTAVHNDYFRIKYVRDMNGKWQRQNPAVDGTKLLTNQVEALRAAGVSKIDTYAARYDTDDPNEAMNGYYTWPRLGYDGSVPLFRYASFPADLKRQMADNPSGSAHERSIQDVMAVKSISLSAQELADTNAKLQEIDRRRGKPSRTRTTISGAEWWQAHGSSMDMEFDLRDGSLSMRTLRAYQAQKQAE